MGWRSFSKTGEERYEDHPDPTLGGRPVAQGDEGSLAAVIQEDFGHKVGIDLIGGVVVIDPEGYEFQNGRFYWHNPTTVLFACDDTNIMGEYKHYEAKYTLKRDEKGRKVRDDAGKLVQERTDILTDLIFRPIWFTRYTNGIPAKVIGLQTTTPKEMGARNVKLLVTIFADGRIGISGER